ncbi:hypothetical protein GA0115255_112153 [Streptomyces sp. Ncost-T6T-2b]|nr:hypothetical protein GA0115255_112153 [Streptomyces sp. Ncost-T6T-2b]
MERQIRLGEVEFHTGDRIPGLEDALLGTEQDAVPVDLARALRRGRTDPLTFGGQGHQLPYAGGERAVRLGVDAERQHVRRPGQRGRPVSGAVGEGADDSLGPQRSPPVTVEYGHGRQAESRHGAPGAGAGRREIVPAFGDALGDQRLLLREEGPVRDGLRAGGRRGDVGGQQQLDHEAPPVVRGCADGPVPAPSGGRARPRTEDLPQQAARVPPLAPLPGVADGDLLETHPVVPGRTGDVEVAVDHGGDVEAAVPVGGQFGAAPLGELRVPHHRRGFTDERPVSGEDEGYLRVVLREPAGGPGDPGAAPVLPRRVRVGVQEVLVVADDAALVRDGERLLLRVRSRGAEGVVVQEEERRDRHGSVGARPDREGVLGSRHAELPAQRDEVVVAGLAAQLDRVLGHGPQLVVAGGPDDMGEAFREKPERPPDLLGALRDVAGDDQPVGVGRRMEGLDDRPVVGHRRVQVTHGQQTALAPSWGSAAG